MDTVLIGGAVWQYSILDTVCGHQRVVTTSTARSFSTTEKLTYSKHLRNNGLHVQCTSLADAATAAGLTSLVDVVGLVAVRPSLSPDTES